MSTETRNRPQGPAPGAGGRNIKSTSSRVWSDVYDDVTEDEVLRAIKAAPIRQLAHALEEGAFRGDHPARFRCPKCEQWTAEITSACLWSCHACRFTGTRLGLVQLVSADAFAAIRLVESMPVEVAA